MNEQHFGARLTADGALFRLWAPAAKRVDLLLDKPHPLRRGEDGWFSADILGIKAGARYKFRIDDEIDVPDPASAFQPDDVSSPSEVIDHAAYQWRATSWRGRRWQETVVLEAHVGAKAALLQHGREGFWSDRENRRGQELYPAHGQALVRDGDGE